MRRGSGSMPIVRDSQAQVCPACRHVVLALVRDTRHVYYVSHGVVRCEESSMGWWAYHEHGEGCLLHHAQATALLAAMAG